MGNACAAPQEATAARKAQRQQEREISLAAMRGNEVGSIAPVIAGSDSHRVEAGAPFGYNSEPIAATQPRPVSQRPTVGEDAALAAAIAASRQEASLAQREDAELQQALRASAAEVCTLSRSIASCFILPTFAAVAYSFSNYIAG